MPLKTKGMESILEPVKVQIHKLRDLLKSMENSDSLKLEPMRLMFSDELHTLGKKLDTLLSKEDYNSFNEMKSRITELIEQFCSTKKKIDLTTQALAIDGESLIDDLLGKFTIALEALEKLECLPLKQSLKDSWDYVEDMGSVQQIEDFQNIKELGDSIVEVFGPLQIFRKSLLSNLLSEKVALYSSQLCAALNILFQLVQEQHQLNAPIYGCKNYACNRMSWCFKMLLEVIDAPHPSTEVENLERENHFVYRMDIALDILAGISGKSSDAQIEDCTALWLAIEEVFAHAMAIAQVCHPYNFNAITGISQSIITEYESLKVQLNSEKPDPSINNLLINTLNDALYRLEQKVNVSMLTLVMEVFSDPIGPLKKLIKICGNALAARKRGRSDLSNAIEEFDQVTDKAMQIGMFAIACCKDLNRVAKIRNCLASLESLEPELVPAIEAFYLHPDNKEMRATVKLLTAQWQLEMQKLHKLINVIIDSGAYCQVILDDMQQQISKMSDCLDNREGVTQTQVNGVLQRALSLSNQISATINDIGRDNIERPTTVMIQELKAAIYEAGIASKLLTNNATEPQQLRVIKRCELILNVVKRVQPALVSLINSSTSVHTSYVKASIGQGDTLHDPGLTFSGDTYNMSREEQTFTYIRTPYTVNSKKPSLSIQPANSVPRLPISQSCLIPYIKRGRSMRTNRSIMYRTPNRSDDSVNDVQSLGMKKNPSIIRQHLFSRDTFVAKQDIDMYSESLDLTGILDKVTCHSDTLTSKVYSNTSTSKAWSLLNVSSPDLTQALPNTEGVSDRPGNRNKCDSIMTTERVDQCSTIGGGDAPSAIDVSERAVDLQRLDKKILFMQKQISTE
ncbi:uncharacterized protein LOC105684901 isoform X2 [Athalia rosae]|uniref:uncharacterized protein LOC105684901 isoform X2 n=1 Tax=Athalia rosae TaxID=37344 RepID=UPI002033F0C3|nr:uncharacterized protein LOC105684901 isoform X2 [Athalia rosae]